jgi:hypothetical protein
VGTGPKIVIGVAVVLVALFVLSVLNPSGDGEGDPGTDQGGLAGLLKDTLADQTAVDPRDLSSQCRKPDGRLEVKGSCVLLVAPADQKIRTLRYTTSRDISVTAPPPDQEPVTADIDAGKIVNLAVGPRGAKIELDCGALNTCVLTPAKGS